jgi:hypothetical protein
MKKYICLLFITLSILACNNDDDTPQNNESALEGGWSLTNVIGGLAGIDDDYESDVIVWNFNQANQELTVTNTNIETVIFDGLPTGVYDYQVMTNTDQEVTLIIEEFDFRVSVLTETSFILDEGAFTNDGFQLTFSR